LIGTAKYVEELTVSPKLISEPHSVENQIRKK